MPAWALSILPGLLEAFLNAFGKSLNDLLSGLRAERTQRELGAANAKLDTATSTIEAQQDQLQAQADAPRTVLDAVRRLEEGSA